MKGFFDYIPGNSIFHKMNPITKLFFAFIICASCFISSSIIFLIAIIFFNIIIGIISEITDRTFTLFRGLIKISSLLFVLQIFFIQNGKTIFEFPFGLKITDNGIFNALRLVLRLTGSALPLAIMLSITKLSDLSNALVEKLHIPYKYAFTLTTAIRFIPIFSTEMSGIIEAQTSRGVELDSKNPFKKISLILPLCAPLLISSIRKTDSIAIAADLRGFDFRTVGSCIRKYPFRIIDILCFVFCILLIVASLIL